MAIRHVVTRGFIGAGTGIDFVPTAGFTSSSVVAVVIAAPYCVVVIDAFVAGAVLADGYTSGAIKAEGFSAGSVISQEACD